MERCVHELLEFYQREMRDREDGRKLLQRFGITSMDVIEHFKLGYCSGKALELASDRTARRYKELGLVKKAREIFTGCIVFPLTGEDCELVDLFGMRYSGECRRYFFWQDPPKGMIGMDALRAHKEILLADNPYYALQVRQLGFPNIVGLRWPEEAEARLALLSGAALERIYLVSRKHRPKVEPPLQKLGADLVIVNTHSDGNGLLAENFASVGRLTSENTVGVQLVNRNSSRLIFAAKDVRYRVDLAGMSGLRSHIRAERDERSFLDRVDLGSASARQRFAKGCAMGLLVSSLEVEAHLSEIAAVLDSLQQEENDQARQVKVLSRREEAEAEALLKETDVLETMSRVLEKHFGIVGEEANRKLALLVVASRLLPKPLGCIVRGAASSGKSSLIQSAARLLPESQVLNFSRLTSQALYFLPRTSLMHSVMVVDEYEGVSDSEYSLRTLMSSQMLSLAITVRDGGGLPTTRTVQIPARVAVLVSTTTPVNGENLSRFVELRMDTSAAQTERVLQRMANSQSTTGSGVAEVHRIQNANQLLKPCRVTIPYAEKLSFGNASVLARRQFGHVIGLVAAHAALYQEQRRTEKQEGGTLLVEAKPEDYQVVYSLVQHMVDIVEETLSPAAVELLTTLHKDGGSAYTIKQIMPLMGWSYSKTYRSLGELVNIRLAVPDQHTNGVQRVYEVAPYTALDAGLLGLPAPGEV